MKIRLLGAVKYCHLITPEASRIVSLDLSFLLWSVFRYLCLFLGLNQLLGGLVTPPGWLYFLFPLLVLDITMR
ncbi:hypothetical protein VN97_g213 [Penicillium thymicola]|uniref:Uncharacterized protein n=1 Tax=Penicillium thymicola TaxID=293382 RepID=A0AAI9XDY3_PENTH|nr:hypothetical protein VN97_g213 [Penicillium thymicola]